MNKKEDFKTVLNKKKIIYGIIFSFVFSTLSLFFFYNNRLYFFGVLFWVYLLIFNTFSGSFKYHKVRNVYKGEIISLIFLIPLFYFLDFYPLWLFVFATFGYTELISYILRILIYHTKILSNLR